MRKTALAASGVALALAATACGGDSDDQGGNASQDQSPEGTFGSIEELVDAAEEGTDENSTAKMSMEMEAEDDTVNITGEGRFAKDEPALAMVAKSEGEEIEVRFTDNTMYFKPPEEERAGDKPWGEISPDSEDPVSQQLSSQFGQLASEIDVSNMLGQMKAGGTITDSEETELDGEPANRYSVDLNMQEIMGGQGAPGDPEAEQMQEQMPESVPAQIWLDEDQLPMKYTMDQEAFAEAAGMPADDVEPLVVDYSDWGTDVDTEAPSEDEIDDITKVMPMPS